MSSTWEDLKARVSVSDVLELLDIDPPERVPGLIRCPIHDDDTPSLNVDETLWYCHGCGKGGDIFNLIQFMGASRSQSAALLERAFAGNLDGMPVLKQREEAPPVDFRDDWKNYRRFPEINTHPDGILDATNERLRLWLQEKWPDQLVTVNHLDAWGCRLDSWNLLIPHYTTTGEITGIKVRKMVPPDIGAKSAITGSQFRHLYRVPSSPPAPWEAPTGEALTLFLCEGETDTWTLQRIVEKDLTSQQRRVVVAGLPGANSYPRHLEELRRFSRVHLFLDMDATGGRVAQEILAGIASDTTTVQIHHMPRKDVTESYAAGWRPTV